MINKDSKRSKIIAIAILAGGAIARFVADELCGSKRYAKKIIDNLVNAGEFERRNKGKPHYLKMTQAGLKIAKELYPHTCELILDEGSNNLKQREKDAHTKVYLSIVLYMQMLCNVPILTEEKSDITTIINTDRVPLTYFLPKEIREHCPSEERKDISQMKGITINYNDYFFHYLITSENMLLSPAAEKHMIDRIKTKFNIVGVYIYYNIIYIESLDLLANLLPSKHSRNDKLLKKIKRIGVENSYFVVYGKEGVIDIMGTYYRTLYREIYFKVAESVGFKKETILTLKSDPNYPDNNVYVLYNLSLKMLYEIINDEKPVSVLCRAAYKTTLRKILSEKRGKNDVICYGISEDYLNQYTETILDGKIKYEPPKEH